MKEMKKRFLYWILAVSLIGGVGAQADNAAIINAIKANPSLLDSPQAKAMIQSNQSVQATSNVKAIEAPIENKIEVLDVKDNSSKKEEDPVSENNQTRDTLYRSPLLIEKENDYTKRLLSRQIIESSRTLKRYGIEFFSNKNGMDLASLPVPENYKLVPKDVINVVMYGPKTDNMSLSIDKDGSIVIPSFGPLNVAGLSFGEAKKSISDALMAAYPNVGVTVNITQFSSIQVTLAGEVAVPGLYNVSSFSTIKEALIAAGGLSPNGSMRSVMIKRQGRVFAEVDLYTIIRGTGRTDPLLRAGDVIIVPIMGKSVIIDGDVKRPGIYEGKSNTTIGNLLAYAGGISASASKNDIRITRYEGHKGVKVYNVSLFESQKMDAMDQDRVYVHNLDKSNLHGVTLYGNILKPGFWPLLKEGMTIKELFGREITNNTLRGVFLEDTYFEYAIIKRTNSNLKEELIGFSLSEALSGKEKITLKNRDELYILNRSTVNPPSVVNISGECIARSGEYKYLVNMTLEALLSTAGTTCPVDRSKITIVSKNPALLTYKVRVVDMNREKVVLEVYDDVRVMGYYTTNPIREAQINGEIFKPGKYPIVPNETTIKDLIFAAGGMNEKASMEKLELIRYEILNGTRTRKVQTLRIDDVMSGNAPTLQSYDELTIFKTPQWNDRKVVNIGGKVKYPGTYAIEDGDTISSVLTRAGGFAHSAYIEGAVFTREDLKLRQKEAIERQINDLENNILYIATQPTEAGQMANDKTQLINLLTKLKDDINATTFVGRLAIQLDKDIEKIKNSSSDIVLKDGDSLYIPEREDSVVVQGHVFNPNAIVYNPQYNLDDYIQKVGGVKDSADVENIFIVHANGEAEAFKTGYFFYPETKIGPGDLIVVPMQIKTFSGMQLAKDITAILYQLAVSAAALQTVGAL